MIFDSTVAPKALAAVSMSSDRATAQRWQDALSRRAVWLFAVGNAPSSRHGANRRKPAIGTKSRRGRVNSRGYPPNFGGKGPPRDPRVLPARMWRLSSLAVGMQQRPGVPGHRRSNETPFLIARSAVQIPGRRRALFLGRASGAIPRHGGRLVHRDRSAALCQFSYSGYFTVSDVRFGAVSRTAEMI